MREYWWVKTEEIAAKPKQFFQTFKPFISTKCKDERTVLLKLMVEWTKIKEWLK